MEQENVTLWAARDGCGDLYLYNHKPIRSESKYVWDNDIEKYNDFNSFYFDDSETDLFSSIRTDDEEPTEVEITIKKK